MLRLKINHMSNKHESTLKVYGVAGGQKQTQIRPGRTRAGGSAVRAVEILRPFATRPLMSGRADR